MSKKVIVFIFVLFLLSLPYIVRAEESFTITTYYPSPYGVYDEMRANKIVIGDPNSSTTPAPTTAGLLIFKGGLVSDPVGANDAQTGTLYYNASVNKFKYWNGSMWKELGGYTQACVGTLCCTIGTDCYKTGPGGGSDCPDSSGCWGYVKLYASVRTYSDGRVFCTAVPSCGGSAACGCTYCSSGWGSGGGSCTIR